MMFGDSRWREVLYHKWARQARAGGVCGQCSCRHLGLAWPWPARSLVERRSSPSRSQHRGSCTPVLHGETLGTLVVSLGCAGRDRWARRRVGSDGTTYVRPTPSQTLRITPSFEALVRPFALTEAHPQRLVAHPEGGVVYCNSCAPSAGGAGGSRHEPPAVSDKWFSGE